MMEIQARILCEVCQKTFQCQANLTVHMRIHTGERPYKCKHCRRAFSQKPHLTTHMKLHLGPGRFKCQKCLHFFQRQADLERHVVRHHPEVRNLDRSVVKVAISGGEASPLHNPKGIEEKYDMPTKIKRKTPANESSLETHQLTHEAPQNNLDPPSVIEECPIKEGTARKLEFQCRYSYCAKVFSAQNDLNLHMKIHKDEQAQKSVSKSKGEKVQKTFVKSSPVSRGDIETFHCEKCNRSFRSYVYLKLHMDAHKNLKGANKSRSSKMLPFVRRGSCICPLCQKRFSNAFNMKRHRLYSCQGSQRYEKKKKSHLFKCMLCSRSYTEKSNLKRHLQINHNKDVGQIYRLLTKSDSHVKGLSGSKTVHSFKNQNKSLIRKTVCSKSEKCAVKTYDKLSQSYRCPLCVRRYTMRSNLCRHLRIQHGTKLSDISSSCHSSKSQDGSSVKTHSQKLCETSTTTDNHQKKNVKDSVKRSDDRSLKATDTEKLTQTYRCPLCVRRYTMRSNLSRHLRIQHGTKLSDISRSCHSSRNQNGRTVVTHSQKPCATTTTSANEQNKDVKDSVKQPGDGSLKATVTKKITQTYRCPLCVRSYAYKDNLRRHIRNGHERKFLQTSISRDSLDSKGKHLVKTHTIDNQASEESDYTCPVCEKSFTQKCNLTVHLRIHTAEKPYACPCGKKFSQLVHVQAHMQRHSQVKSKIFIEGFDKEVIPEHTKDENSPALNNKKDLCMNQLKSCDPLIVPSGQSFSHHAQGEQTDRRPYKCSCGMSFFLLHHLKSHVPRHMLEGSRLFIQGFNPDTVSYLPSTKYLNKGLYKRKKRKGHAVYFKCKFCDCQFDYAFRLRVHMRSHSRSGNVNSGRRSVTAKNKRNVTETKSEEWKCKVCRKRFHHIRSYTRHLQFHTNPQSRLFIKTVKPGILKKQLDLMESSGTHYKCKLCKKIFKSASSFKQHMHHHSSGLDQLDTQIKKRPLLQTSGSTIRCLFCKKSYKRAQFEAHLRTHTGIRPYKCEVCKHRFAKVGCLSQHMKRHTQKQTFSRTKSSKTSLKCKVCNRFFNHIGNLYQHLKFMHTGKSKVLAGKNTEWVEGQRSSIPSNSRKGSEENSVKCEKKPYTCSLCHGTFHQNTSLKRHIALKHKHPVSGTFVSKSVKSESVNSRMNASFEYARNNNTTGQRSAQHIKTESKFLERKKNALKTTTKKFVCTLCDRRYECISNLTEHCRIHFNERPFKCQVCGFGFKQKHNLKRHFRTQHGDLKLVVKGHGSQSVRKGTEAVNDQAWNITSKVAKGSKVLRSYSHHGATKLKLKARNVLRRLKHACIVCENVYKSTSTLNVHMRIHTGQMPFQCEICQKKFIHSSNRNDHVKRMHKQKKVRNNKHCVKVCFDDGGERITKYNRRQMRNVSSEVDDGEDGITKGRYDPKSGYIHEPDSFHPADIMKSDIEGTNSVLVNRIKTEVSTECDPVERETSNIHGDVIVIDDDEDDGCSMAVKSQISTNEIAVPRELEMFIESNSDRYNEADTNKKSMYVKTVDRSNIDDANEEGMFLKSGDRYFVPEATQDRYCVPETTQEAQYVRSTDRYNAAEANEETRYAKSVDRHFIPETTQDGMYVKSANRNKAAEINQDAMDVKLAERSIADETTQEAMYVMSGDRYFVAETNQEVRYVKSGAAVSDAQQIVVLKGEIPCTKSDDTGLIQSPAENIFRYMTTSSDLVEKHVNSDKNYHEKNAQSSLSFSHVEEATPHENTISENLNRLVMKDDDVIIIDDDDDEMSYKPSNSALVNNVTIKVEPNSEQNQNDSLPVGWDDDNLQFVEQSPSDGEVRLNTADEKEETVTSVETIQAVGAVWAEWEACDKGEVTVQDLTDTDIEDVPARYAVNENFSLML